MALMLKKDRHGNFRKYWYGELQDCTGRKIVNLGKWHGTPPPSLHQLGDAEFEASRQKARDALKEAQQELSSKGRAEHLVQRLIESKTGKQVEYVRLAELPHRWRTLPRETQPTESWLKTCDTMFKTFAASANVEYLHEVTSEMVAAYLSKLRSQCTRKTARNVVSLFRSAFTRFLPPGAHNPFTDGIARKSEPDEGDTIHRRPFTAVELGRLFEAAQDDDFMYPLIVAAACTGMRRGDVCRLKWDSVDFENNVIDVKTSKTGASVEIPIFPPLLRVLRAADAQRRKGDVYVWPAALRMADESPDGLTWRFKKLLASILTDTEVIDMKEGAPARETVALSGVLEAVCAAVTQALEGKIRERTLNSLERYADGASIRDIQTATGQPRSGVSADLHRAEKLSGINFMPAATQSGAKDKIARLTQETRGRGQRAASVLDWHALRVTWVTLALSAGVPMELVKLVTGHKTVEVVVRHYFKPNRDHLREALQDKLPDVLTGGPLPLKTAELAEPQSAAKKKASPRVIAKLAAKVADGTATDADRKRLSALLAG